MKSKGGFVLGLVIVLAVLVGGAYAIIRVQSTPEVATIKCVGGSEKTQLMADPDIKEILADKYQLTVEWKPQGSYDQVLQSAEQIEAQGYDCLWPSSASAQNVFESTHSGEFPDYRALTVLQSPEVIYSGPQATDALVRAGLVREQDAHYVADLKTLLLDHIVAGDTWQNLQAGSLQGPMNISSTDPARSNSGFTMAQLQLTIVA
ncbi:MAG: hypothetical protein GXX86_00900, partial [Propionibacterium sp.]|nr:hypothetical protein [Propionibacterium sp.]